MDKVEELNMCCQECKAVVKVNEFHSYEYCLIAKAYPNEWRDIIKRITKNKQVKVDEGKIISILRDKMSSIRSLHPEDMLKGFAKALASKTEEWVK